MKDHRIIPIYTTPGDVGAFLYYPYLFSAEGEWIGWVTPEREVFSVQGVYVGDLNKDPRILRKHSASEHRARRSPPPPPDRIRPPAIVPLAPLMAELPNGVIDVLAEAPDMLPPVDFGDLREDMD